MENKETELVVNVNIESLKELSKIISQIQSQIAKMNNMSWIDIGNLTSGIVSAITSLGSIAIAYKSMKKSVDEEIKDVAKVITNNSIEIKNSAVAIGKNLAEGMIQGIKQSKPKLNILVEELGEDNIIKTTMKTLEISSPSKVMERLGEFIPKGFGKGIRAGEKDVKGAMNDISDTVESSAKKTSKTKFSFGGIAAVATIVGTLVGYFVNLMSTNEELSGKMGEVWAKIQEALSPVIEVVTSLFDAFATGGEGTTSVLDTIVEVIGSVAEFIAGVIETIVGFFQENSDTVSGIVNTVWEFISGIIEFAKEIFAGLFEVLGAFFAEHGDEIMAAVTTIWEFISGIIEGAKEIIGGVLDIIVGIFTGNGEKIKEGFGRVWEGIKGIFSGVGDFFSGIWSKVVSIFTNVGTKIGDAIGGAFKAVVNAIIGFAEKTINGFLKAINGAIGLINKIPGVNIKKIELLTIPKLAGGGLVDAGQVFVAREAGPELVGSFGAKTAVMNNKIFMLMPSA